MKEVPQNWICGAGQLGFRVSLQPWHSFLNRFAKVALCPEGCRAQNSNLGLGLVPELLIPALWGVGRGKGTPNSVVEQGCTHTKILMLASLSFSPLSTLVCSSYHCYLINDIDLAFTSKGLAFVFGRKLTAKQLKSIMLDIKLIRR